MKYTYRINPPDWDVASTERLYSDMSKKGWLLIKRGQSLSKFKRSLPEDRLYRVEFATKEFMDDTYIPDEKLELIEDGGWQYVTGRAFVHIFTAPKDSDPFEIHTDPRSQAATMKSIRRDSRWAFVFIAFYFAFILFMSAAMSSDSVSSVIVEWRADIIMEFYTHTAFLFLLTVVLLWSFYSLIAHAVGTAKLYRRLKHGVPVDRTKNPRHLLRKCVFGFFLSITILSAGLFAAELCSYRRYDMPEKSRGQYLTISEMGISGERVPHPFGSGESDVEHYRSLVCYREHTTEIIKTDAGKTIWLYQDIYKTASQGLAEKLVPIIMDDALFARGRENFTPLKSTGFDEVYTAALETVIRDGDTVYMFTSLAEDEITANAVIKALLGRCLK